MVSPTGSPPGRGERLRPAERLSRRADYLRCYRTGRRRQAGVAILYFIPSRLGHARVGITVSRKVGNAVIRHRLKRWILEIYRRWPGRGELGPFDLVVHLKPDARAAGFDEFRAELLRLLRSLPDPRSLAPAPSAPARIVREGPREASESTGRDTR